MNVYGRFTAAVGSIALNVALALLVAQGAGAAVPAMQEQPRDPQTTAVSATADHPAAAHEHCTRGLRAREILAVLLALVV
jgi:hypothetical protein